MNTFFTLMIIVGFLDGGVYVFTAGNFSTEKDCKQMAVYAKTTIDDRAFKGYVCVPVMKEVK